jgi:hypothetical protein
MGANKGDLCFEINRADGRSYGQYAPTIKVIGDKWRWLEFFSKLQIPRGTA